MTRLTSNTIVACPHCQQLARKKSIASFSTGDVTRWSDGYASSWFRQPSFTRCKSCRGVFWLEDATRVGEIPQRDERPTTWISRFFGVKATRNAPRAPVPDTWYWAQPIEHPDIDAIIIGIEALGNAPKEKEQRIRRLLWWTLNDCHRNPTRTMPSVSQTIRDTHEESNLLRLLVLSEEDGEPTLETVEICRELGRFDEAKAALDQLPASISGIEVLADKIRERDSRVCILKGPDWNP